MTTKENTMSDPMMSERPAKTYIRDAWRERIEGAESIDVHVVSQEIADELLQNQAFCSRFLNDFLVDVIVDVGNYAIKSLRDTRREQRMIPVGGKFVTPEAIRREVREEIEAQAESKWAKWFEFDPISKNKISLPSMKKRQILAAAVARATRGKTDLQEAHWLRLIAGRMDDEQTVSEVWKDDELDNLRDRLVVKIEAGLKPIQLRSEAA